MFYIYLYYTFITDIYFKLNLEICDNTLRKVATPVQVCQVVNNTNYEK